MGKGNFSDDFKRDAVAQITERGYPVAEVSWCHGVTAPRRFAAVALRLEEDVRQGARGWRRGS